jgi:hypothetical protein
MKRRHKIAVIFAAAAALLGVGGAVAAAHPVQTRPQTPVVTDQPNDGPDTPGVPDVPEPGDTPDEGD